MANELKYVLGLDLGVASIGWAVMKYNENDEPEKLIDTGVVVFSSLDNDKGKLYNADRRDKRGSRRVTRRRADRLRRTKGHIVSSGLISKDELHNLYNSKIRMDDVYSLRIKGLTEKLTNEELARVLVHYSKNRGFKSNRKIEDIVMEEDGKDIKVKVSKASADDKKLKPAIEKGTELIQKENITVTQAIMKIKDEKGLNTFKNKGGSYNYGFTRAQVLEEITKILKRQQEENSIINDKFIEKFVEIFSSQRDFSEGPGGDSKYKVDFRSTAGRCKYTGDRRVVASAPSYEIFSFLQRVNDIRYYDNSEEALKKKREKKGLEPDIIKKIYEAVVNKNKAFNFKVVQECLDIKDVKFLNIPEISKADYKKIREEFRKKIAKKKGIELEKLDDLTEEENILFYDKLNEERMKKDIYILKRKKEIEKELEKQGLSKTQIIDLGGIKFLDEVASVLTYAKTDNKMDELFREEFSSIPEKKDDVNVREIIKKMNNYNGIGMLSLELIYKLNEEMLKGNDYEKSMSILGYSLYKNVDDSKKFDTKFPTISQIETRYNTKITNPNVKHVLVHLRKLYNSLIRRYGTPYRIHIELARDLSNDFSTRNKMKREQINNFEARQAASFDIFNANKDLLLGRDQLSNEDIMKKRLYDEQFGTCMYSAKKIDMSILFTNQVQIDHILPYSKSYDDSYSNKVLVLTEANQEKRDRTPYQWIGKNKDKWEEFKKRVRGNSNLSLSKKDKLLFTEKIERDEFLERSFHATTYVSKISLQIFKNILNDSKTDEEKKNNVIPFKGTATSYLRKFWGLNRITHNYENEEFKRKESYELGEITVDSENSKVVLTAKNAFGDEISAEMKVEKDRNGVYKTAFNEDLYLAICQKNGFEKINDIFNVSNTSRNLFEIKEKELIDLVKINKNIVTEVKAFIRLIAELKGKVSAKNRENHLHHAVDAILISVMSRSTQMRLTKFNNLIQQVRNGDRDIIDPDSGEMLTPKDILEKFSEFMIRLGKYDRVQINIEELKDKKFILPYPYRTFKEEIKWMVFERKDMFEGYDSLLGRYTADEIKNISVMQPYRVLETKPKGALHAETLLGESKNQITKRISIDDLDKKKLEKLFDKDGSQKEVYNVLNKWLDNKKKTEPILKNGKIIKKIKIVDENKEKFIKLGHKRYAEMGQTLAEIRVFKKQDDNKYYFLSLGNYNLHQLKKGNKDFGVTIWWGQAKSKEYLNYGDLEKKGYKYEMTLRSTEVVSLKVKEGESIVRIVGYTSGMLEVESVVGDGIDLIVNKLSGKIKSQFHVTVSTIQEIKKIRMNIFGEVIE